MAYDPPQPSIPQYGTVTVIGPQYCVPYNVDLAVTPKSAWFTCGNYTVANVNREEVFKVKDKYNTSSSYRILVDHTGHPIVTIKQKLLSMHDRWKVFKGDSSEKKDLLFSVKRSSVLQLKTKLHVFLAANKEEEACDFEIQGSWFERSCIVYLGNSGNIIAKMRKRHKGNVIFGKDVFRVTVHPNVDAAFVVALIVVLDGIIKNGQD